MNVTPSSQDVARGNIVTRIGRLAEPRSANSVASLVIETLDEFAAGSYPNGSRMTGADYVIDSRSLTVHN
jgi:hypothetical protein